MKQKWPKIEVDPLHSICTYLGSFPPELANFFINYFTDENDVVYDPFSGRGTSLLEARRLNRHAISSDLNPISIYLSKSKSCQLNRSKILARIKQLKNDYDYVIIDSAPCLLVSDTFQYINLADSVIYIFRANFTDSKIIFSCIDQNICAL